MFFVIWRGWGLLAILIPPVFLFLGMFAAGAVFGKEFYETNGKWYMPLILLLSSAFVYYLGRKLNSNNEKVLIDPKTDEEVILKNSHDLFWIPMQYWGIIFGIISLLLLFVSSGYMGSAHQ